MRNRFRLKAYFIALLFVLPCLLNANDSIEYLKYFSSLSSRVPGYQGHIEASNFIEKKFKEAGLTKITKEKFNVPMPVQEFAYVTVDGKNTNLYCLWPNLIRTSTVPPAGVKGKIIYAKKGDWKLLDGHDIEGSIILLDFDSADMWQTLAMLGARAFVFTNLGNITRLEAEKKFVDTPIDVPRFYAGENSQYLIDVASKNKDAEIFARMTWQKTDDYNIFGYMEGKNSKLKNEVIVIQSYYDSISVVPSVAPGATSSIGIATMLEIAEYFKENPPDRTLLFLATSSHFHSMRGINDFVQKHLRKDPLFKKRISDKDRINVSLFIGLELSDRGSGLGVWYNSEEAFHQRAMTSFARKFLDYSGEICKRFGYNEEFALVNGIMPEKGRVWNTFMPCKIRTDGEYVIYSGVPSVSLVTVNDGRWRVDTPTDTFEKVNIANVKKQTFFIKKLLEKAVGDEKLFPETELDLKDSLASLTVNVTTFDPTTSFVPKDPVVNALVVPRMTGRGYTQEKTSLGVRNSLIGLADERGRAHFSMLKMSTVGELSGFLLDTETGKIVLASDLGSGGAQQYPIRVVMDYRDKSWMHVLFEAKPIGVFELIDPQYLTSLNKIDVFDRANSLPTQYGFYLRNVFSTWTSYAEPLAVVFAKPDTHVKVIGLSGLLGRRLLLLNSEGKDVNQEKAEGMGFAVDDINSILNTPYQGARDMDILSSFRKTNFEKFGIKNERLTELQEESRKLLAQAEEARKEKKWYDFLKFSRQALAMESRAYPDVRNTANDVVKGIIFYFMLLLPFAFFAERLIFGFSKTEARIAGIGGIFLVVYWIMRSVHPAFKLTEAPEVILLSFIVLTLSGIVITIIASKFEEQMQQMKMESTSIYNTDVGRVTATATAFSLGVANMKRRKVRTALTSVTLILLTFTVLSFTSIKTHMKFNKVLRPYNPSYKGILFRDRSHAPITNVVFDYVENEFSSHGVISPRAWYIMGEVGDRTAIDVISDGNSFLAMGLLGLSANEVMPFKDSLTKGQWFDSDNEDSVIISERTATHLGLSKNDVGIKYVEIYGKEFLLKGMFDGKAFGDMKDLDNELITPVNFSVIPELELTQIKSRRQRVAETTETELDIFPRVESDNVIIMPFTTLMNMNGTINSIAIGFNEDVDGMAVTESFVSKLAVNIFAGLEGKTYVYSSIGLTSFSGLANLLIPILIAALIVLNTMLGSVYERIREIGTYSAVGLAPVHISSLFLAESLVYAVLGAVSGYLLGQILAKFLMSMGMLKGLVLNYSSLSAVFATIIIFITVLLSTLYPARKASQMAVPDVTRRWILPEPKGDLWEFEFPFTLNEIEVLGMVTFLTEYYNAYLDISIGNFYTSGAELKYEKLDSGKNKYLLDTKVWLAPFDLAVSQSVRMVLKPMGEYDFYLITLVMKRTSGEETDWKRLNRRFLDSMRKQFLIWRTVNEEVKKNYEKKGKEILKID